VSSSLNGANGSWTGMDDVGSNQARRLRQKENRKRKYELLERCFHLLLCFLKAGKYHRCVKDGKVPKNFRFSRVWYSNVKHFTYANWDMTKSSQMKFTQTALYNCAMRFIQMRFVPLLLTDADNMFDYNCTYSRVWYSKFKHFNYDHTFSEDDLLIGLPESPTIVHNRWMLRNQVRSDNSIRIQPAVDPKTLSENEVNDIGYRTLYVQETFDTSNHGCFLNLWYRATLAITKPIYEISGLQIRYDPSEYVAVESADTLHRNASVSVPEILGFTHKISVRVNTEVYDFALAEAMKRTSNIPTLRLMYNQLIPKFPDIDRTLVRDSTLVALQVLLFEQYSAHHSLPKSSYGIS
jgi:hypothetical protein